MSQSSLHPKVMGSVESSSLDGFLSALQITFLSLFSSITRTFASGKTEKVIFQALKELGLPSGKVFLFHFKAQRACVILDPCCDANILSSVGQR